MKYQKGKGILVELLSRKYPSSINCIFQDSRNKLAIVSLEMFSSSSLYPIASAVVGRYLASLAQVSNTSLVAIRRSVITF